MTENPQKELPPEVPTTEAKNCPTVWGLPRSHWHCSLDNFNWQATRPLPLRDRVFSFLAAVENGEKPHLILTGSAGIGKSHLGVAAYRHAAAHWGTRLTMWLSVPDFCDQVKAGYNRDTPGLDPFEEYEDARRLVVLDDLFGRDLSAHEASAIVYRLINVAYQNGAAMLVTMNQPAESLSSRMAQHETSRLLAEATVITMSADVDYRRRKK